MILKPAQHNYVDCFDESILGWVGHTRVQVKKTPEGKRAFYVSGLRLPKIRMVEVAKTV